MEEDIQLIQEVQAGDREAFRKLVLKYQDYVYSVCKSILKDGFEAREAAQDTFMKIHRAINTFNAESKFTSWMYKIAYRTSLDYIRKRKPVSDIDNISGEDKAEESGADTEVENKELKDELLEAISKLDGDEAAIVRMFYLEEMNVKELEEITGLSNSNIKVKLYRARKKLFKIINEEHKEVKSYL